jgi:hypothetical protein
VLQFVLLIERVVVESDDDLDPQRGRFWRADGSAVVAQYEASLADGGAEAALRFIEERRELVSKHREVCRSFLITQPYVNSNSNF